MEERLSQSEVKERLGIKSNTQIVEWVRKYKAGETFEDYRGLWKKKKFNSTEKENAHLKAQVEYLKKAQSKSTRGGKLDKEARFRIVSEMRKRYSIVQLCQLAEVSRAGYYKWNSTEAQRKTVKDLNADLKEYMLAIHRLRPHLGYIRMRTALRKEGFRANHKKVRRLMREFGIRSVIRKKRPNAARKPSNVFANILNGQFTAEAAGEKLVTDITYVRVVHDFVYLSAVLDLYNNEIVSWEASSRNDLQLVLETVKPLQTKGALLHSDQGFQYTSGAYAKQLEKQTLGGSLSRCGNCFDNACIESFFSNLKTEKLYLEKPQDEC